MDIFAIFFVALISLIAGIIVTLCIQYYIFYVYLKKSPLSSGTTPKKSFEYYLPDAIKHQLGAGDMSDKSKGGLAISLIMQFLFHELRHSEAIKRWLYKKLTMEFDELLTKTTMGKCFDSISIKDMDLGSQFPDIKDISVESVKLDEKEEHIEVLNLGLNVDYSGNFLLCIDAKMKFSKTAYLSIKVKKICGFARLQFSRQPYTHWSFSFYTEPVLELAVESHFQGRQLQSNITNLIVNQIKKAIKRKHTLPNYKIRYKPFFVKTDPSQLDIDDSENALQGTLEMNVSEVSRLSLPDNAQNIYLTIAIDAIPWICLCQKNEAMVMTLEITMTKLKQTQLGVIFRQEAGSVVVDSVTSNSCAYHAGLRAADVVVSVENKLVTTVPQVAKYMKSVSGTNVTLRVERAVENYITKWKLNDEKEPPITIASEVKCEDSETELTQQEQESFVIIENIKKEERKARAQKIIPSNENMAKLAQTISSFSLRKRKILGGGASPNTPQRSRVPPAKKNSTSDLPEIVRTEVDSLECEHIFSAIEIFKGKELRLDNVLPFDDDFRFIIKEGAKYINVNAWATFNDSPDVLLGYLNIPLNYVASECSSSVLGHHSRRYSFLPPGVTSTATVHPLRAHSGFEHVFCFGDALLTFAWSPIENPESRRKTSTAVDNKTDVSGIRNKHDFVRTQFHGTTHCDFCSKKIWLKDAVQCRQCGMCCHKKCVAKCQTSSSCSADSSALPKTVDAPLIDAVLQPDGCFDDAEGMESNLKRVNSVTNLSIPGSPSFSSRSLPPSPQRTPIRKQSLICVNPFSLCPIALEEVQKTPQDSCEIISRLLDQVISSPPDENLMDNAKESGQKMYVHLEIEEKREKINLMMAELKKTLDLTTTEHMELTKKMNLEESEVEKAKLAFLVGQADAKVHALSVLMLHYCSGLQYSHEKIL
ncbi:PDZ domain-containing protein 8 isoform X1 [Dendroctonus ponderosae]|uniref:PDZ domain-containing protein 8 n=2 Tax=Dendroctonus ponderosae TaxID=77166 RepID=A0AAR5Q3M0_DENPD|nr:PDZ domain-containing protein 8 isoform X1 [Dendroctonus ponderosae]